MPVSLRSLSDPDILARTRALAAREREATLSLLLHLCEIERRRLHLKQGYASMFDYCTTALGYSASSAMRRIRAARCVARYPRVYALLEANEVNLSTVSQVSRLLTPANHATVLERIRGKSQREVDAIVAAMEPRAALPPDRVRTVFVPVVSPAAGQEGASSTSMTTSDHNRSGCDRGNSPDEAAARGTALPAPTNVLGAASASNVMATSDYNRSGCDRVDSPVACADTGGVQLERRVVVQFAAREAFMAKVERIRALAWHRLPANASLEQVFEIAVDLFLEKEDPEARRQRREERAAKERAPGQAEPGAHMESPREAKAEQREDPAPPALAGSARAATGAHVPRGTREATRRTPTPTRVRDEVFARDGGRCAFRGPGGKRCASTRAIQVDHVVPVARGGPSAPGNLRLLCAHHNRLEAERLMGSSGVKRTDTRDGPVAH